MLYTWLKLALSLQRLRVVNKGRFTQCNETIAATHYSKAYSRGFVNLHAVLHEMCSSYNISAVLQATLSSFKLPNNVKVKCKESISQSHLTLYNHCSSVYHRPGRHIQDVMYVC